MMHRDQRPRTHRLRPSGRSEGWLDDPPIPMWAPDGLTEAVIDRRYGDLLPDLDTDPDGGAVEQAEATDEPLVGARVLVFPVAVSVGVAA